MPLGSSSAAPVTRPGPNCLSHLRRGMECGFAKRKITHVSCHAAACLSFLQARHSKLHMLDAGNPVAPARSIGTHCAEISSAHIHFLGEHDEEPCEPHT